MEGKRLIYGAIAAFVVTCALLLAFSGKMAPADNNEPRFAVDETARASSDSGGTFQVTLDTSDSRHWVPFDFGAGRIQPLNLTESIDDAQAAHVDLIARRYVLRAPHGAICLGKVPLASARLPASPAWVSDERTRGEMQNPAFKGWYSYSYWSHLLSSTGETYAVRLAGGGVAYLNIASYYCQLGAPGCLTIRYRLELESATAN